MVARIAALIFWIQVPFISIRLVHCYLIITAPATSLWGIKLKYLTLTHKADPWKHSLPPPTSPVSFSNTCSLPVSLHCPFTQHKS